MQTSIKKMISKYKLMGKTKEQKFNENMEIFKNSTQTYFNPAKIFNQINPLNRNEELRNRNLVLKSEIKEKTKEISEITVGQLDNLYGKGKSGENSEINISNFARKLKNTKPIGSPTKISKKEDQYLTTRYQSSKKKSKNFTIGRRSVSQRHKASQMTFYSTRTRLDTDQSETHF